MILEKSTSTLYRASLHCHNLPWLDIPCFSSFSSPLFLSFPVTWECSLHLISVVSKSSKSGFSSSQSENWAREKTIHP